MKILQTRIVFEISTLFQTKGCERDLFLWKELGTYARRVGYFCELQHKENKPKIFSINKQHSEKQNALNTQTYSWVT